MSPRRRIHIPPAQLAIPEGAGADSSIARIALVPEQQRYLVSVLRLGANDPVEIFDGQGNSFSARIALDPEGRASLADLARIEKAAGARSIDIVLAQALAKGDKLELVIQKATELGCARIIPFAAERSIVKLDEERGSTKAARWRKIAEEAARQCGRSDVPLIDLPARWEEIFAILEREPERRGIILDPSATALRLGEAALGADKLLIAVGPEGGFSPEELLRAEAVGAVRASLGPLILRTETAGLAALSIVQHLAGALG